MNEDKLPNQKDPEKKFNIFTLIAFILFAAISLLVAFVLPSFENIFKGQGELPFTTRVILAISEFMQSYFVVIIIVVLILFLVFKTKWKSHFPEINLDSDSKRIIIYGLIGFFFGLFLPMYILVAPGSVLVEYLFKTGFSMVFLPPLFGMAIACIVNIIKSKNSNED